MLTSRDQRIYKAYTTLHEMLCDRGFSLPCIDEEDERKIVHHIRSNPFLMVFSQPYPLVVFAYCGSEKLRIGSLRQYMDRMDEMSKSGEEEDGEDPIIYDRAIILVESGITPFVKNANLEAMVHERSEIPRSFELFSADEWIVNPTRHEYYKHAKSIPCDADEVRRVVKDFCNPALTDEQEISEADLKKLPRLLKTDKMVRYFGLNVGDVMRVETNLSGNNPDVRWKVVVPPEDK